MKALYSNSIYQPGGGRNEVEKRRGEEKSAAVRGEKGIK
jgi:hypothetical protein